MDSKCRLCLEKNASCDIFDANLNIVEQLLRYCNLKAYKYDGLPECVCRKCVKKFKDIEKYFNKCIEIDGTLRAALGIKTENKDTFGEKLKESKLLDIKQGYIQINPVTKDEFKTEFLEDITFDDYASIRHSDSDNLPNSEDDFDSYFEKGKIKGKRKKAKTIDCSKGETKTKYRRCDRGSRLCPVCGKYFKYTNHMIKHTKLHSGKHFKCDMCSKSFLEKRCLAKHILTHTNEKNFKCDFCSKKFKFEKQAKMHMHYMHKNYSPIKCDICNKSLSRKQAFVNHMRTHTTLRPHQCDVCLKSFRSQLLLRSHMRTHADERPFSCMYCNSSFKISKSLKEHERLHTGEKPYLCPVCGKGFAQKGNMRSHFRFNHKDLNFEEACNAVKDKNISVES